MTEQQQATSQLVAISNSEMQTWARCPRKWFITYYLGFLPADEIPHGSRQLGIRVHTALEAHYGYQLDPRVVLQLQYRLAVEQHPEFEHELRAELELADAMVSGYLEWVDAGNEDEGLQVVHTEADIQVPVPGVPGAALRCRMDQVVQTTDNGWLWFLDHKTAGNFDRHGLIEMDPQMRTYSVAQHLAAGVGFHQAGQPGAPSVVAGGMVNTLRRVKRTEKAKPPFYQRDRFRYNPEQLTATLQKIQKLCGEIMTARQSLDWCYAPGRDGDLELVNIHQRHGLRPVQVIHDCSWSCPLAGGLCNSMDDGSDWPGMLLRSGRWVQGDPYAHYDRGGLAAIRDQLAAL